MLTASILPLYNFNLNYPNTCFYCCQVCGILYSKCYDDVCVISNIFWMSQPTRGASVDPGRYVRWGGGCEVRI